MRDTVVAGRMGSDSSLGAISRALSGASQYAGERPRRAGPDSNRPQQRCWASSATPHLLSAMRWPTDALCGGIISRAAV